MAGFLFLLETVSTPGGNERLCWTEVDAVSGTDDENGIRVKRWPIAKFMPA